ncbi:MAG TPA: PDZ domain-containing protein, partial [Thermoanaerobaculia bacterium]|nr:PDZ domain-containing protein [Thermoanaerobaculia bacterium]
MRNSWYKMVLVGLLTVAVVIGAFASFQRKRSSFERIDFTFTRKNGVISVKSVDAGSGAERAGLRPGDEILLIGETPTTEIEGLQKTLRRIGTPVPMIIDRGGHPLTLTYRPPELKIDYPYLILSFIGFLYLAIGLFTLFRGETRDSTLFFFVTLLSFIVYVYTPAGDIDWSYKLLQLVEDLSMIFLPPLALHFFLLFPRPVVKQKWLLALMYVPAGLLAAWSLDLLVFNNAVALM